MSANSRSFAYALIAGCLLLAGGGLIGHYVLHDGIIHHDGDEANTTTGSANDSVSFPSPMVVEVTGREFKWHFRYPGPDATLHTSDDVHSAKELHLPVDSDVELLLKSDDYVYVFALPQNYDTPNTNTAPKQKLREIAVPELTYTMKFRTTSAGTFDLLADPLCNFRFYHDELMGRMVVQSSAEVSEWLNALP